jgi:hypothetical protein
MLLLLLSTRCRNAAAADADGFPPTFAPLLAAACMSRPSLRMTSHVVTLSSPEDMRYQKAITGDLHMLKPLASGANTGDGLRHILHLIVGVGLDG